MHKTCSEYTLVSENQFVYIVNSLSNKIEEYAQ